MGNILNHNKDIFKYHIDKSEYWDFCLARDAVYGESASDEECLIAYIDTNDMSCILDEGLVSTETHTWEDAVSTGATLSYIGCTGVDNGFISFKKDKISNEEFYELFTNSKYTIEGEDYKLYLYRVNGNNGLYDYSCDIVGLDGDTVAQLQGGFYQGFFETKCDEYKILPTEIEKAWHFGVGLRKEELNVSQNVLNSKYPDNKGIFLYIGTRAENKWFKYYSAVNALEKNETNSYISNEEYMEDYVSDTSANIGDYLTEEPLFIERYSQEYIEDSDEAECSTEEGEYLERLCGTNVSNGGHGEFMFRMPEYLGTYQDNAIWYNRDGDICVYNEKEKDRGHNDTVGGNGCCDDYLTEDYVEKNEEDCLLYTSEEYVSKDKEIDGGETPVNSSGVAFDDISTIEYETDNKFLFFDRTCDGYTVDKYDPANETVIISEPKPVDIGNYYMLFNRTCNGYNIDNINKLIHEKSNEYDVFADLYRNAIAFQIKDDGSIGYKYLIQDCDDEDGNYLIKSEFTSAGIIEVGEWYDIDVKLSIVQDAAEYRNKTMQITIYVNGKVRLISEELPILHLRQLNDDYQKQEGVPYNISLGGGTQGLCDVIYMDYYKLPEYVLPLEKEFAGSFIGYIKYFKFYNCDISYAQILSNYQDMLSS